MTTRKPHSSKRKKPRMPATPVVEAPGTQAEPPESAADESTNQSSDKPTEQASESDGTENAKEDYIEYLGKLPPEIGTMLMLAGVAGILLPGPVGTPMLVAGAVVFWPKTFSPVERFFAKCCPGIHQEGVYQVKRYVSDLNRRFPNNPENKSSNTCNR